MKRVSYRLSSYSSDLFGVASALFELGGLTVIHDASGCNSTYTTHDEPRWYDMDSMVYISALTESDAVMGNDRKLIEDIIKTAEESKPKFIAITSSPLPMIMGTDFKGIARIIQKHTRIETMGFNTNGMNTYDVGIAESLSELALRFCKKDAQSGIISGTAATAKTGTTSDPARKTGAKKINLLGLTPLDFSINGNAEELKKYYESIGYKVLSTWAMGNTLEELIYGAKTADLNIAVTTAGIKIAETLKEIYGTPYIAECPVGKDFHKSKTLSKTGTRSEKIVIIGEGIISLGLKKCLLNEFNFKDVIIISPLKLSSLILSKEEFLQKNELILNQNFFTTDEEEDIEQIVQNADIIIADPLYERIISYGKPCDKNSTCAQKKFIPFAHEAYSGRIFHKTLPVFIAEHATEWLKKFF